MSFRIRLAIGACAILLASLAQGDDARAPRHIEVAPGVHLFITPPYGDVGLDGNSIAIVSRDGVLVFDANGTPAAATAVLAALRTLTDQPVRYLVLSHWHWDHWYGAEVYKRAFPDVKIVSHEKTRDMMMGPAIEFNRPGLETGLPGYLQSIEKRLATAEAAAPPPPDLSALRRRVEDARFFLEQKRAVHHTFPTVTFTDRLEIPLGERTIEVRHVDRAVTPGDAFVYLPREKILLSGDLLVNPISFALSCYPSGWIRTLEAIDGLDFSVLVPGHGEPLRDRDLLRATLEVFRRLLAEGRTARDKGLDPDQAKEAIVPGLAPLMSKITKDAPGLNEAFRVQLVDWYLHRVYDELAGPLSDAIAPIPSK